MSSKYLSLIAVAFVMSGTFMWGLQHLPVSTEATSRFSEIKTTISSIPTPEGWYVWSVDAVPSDPTSVKQGMTATFGNQPLDKHGNLPASTITVDGDSLDGATPVQWIVRRVSVVSSDSVDAATSTASTWGVENERLVVENVEGVPAGGHVMSYYLFDAGIVYTFTLTPSPFVPGYLERDKQLINSPDANTLRAMVKQFAASLPAASE